MTGQWKPQAHINVCKKQPGQSSTTLWGEFRPLDKMRCSSQKPVLPWSQIHPAPFPLSLATSQSCSCCAWGWSIPLSLWGWATAAEEGLKASTEGQWLGTQQAAAPPAPCKLMGPAVLGCWLLHPASVKCWWQVFYVSELCFLMLWNIYTINY